MGDGVACPHARLEQLMQPLLAIATLPEPVYFDNAPVQLVCLMLVPASEPTVSLKLMAQLSQVLINPESRRDMLAAASADELRNFFKQHRLQIDKPILARDIMRPPRWSVLETDPVSRCAHLMSTHNLQAIPVVNDTRRIVGEVTAARLFCYGLPDFFSSLKSVSFIAEFDPFEKYFADESRMSTNQLMEPAVGTIPMEYTIMEVVFELAIRNRIKLYVVDEAGHWIGTIDKGTVLNNVINY